MAQKMLSTKLALALMVVTLVTLSQDQFFVEAATGSDWGYSASDGPETEKWGGACKSGSKQSPIDIKKSDAINDTLHKFIFNNWDKIDYQEVALINKGSTVQLEVKSSNGMPTVSGGGLPGTYQFAQFHMHWGTADDKGSEHTIDGKAYPMEIHFVTFNTNYGSNLGEAISGGAGAEDTLAVLGFMFEIDDEDNDDLADVISALPDIVNPSSVKNTVDTRALSRLELTEMDTTKFWRYQGSLTTPGCNEIVVWTVFEDTIPISNGQMKQLRSMSQGGNNVRMVDNFRPTQPLNGRQVKYANLDSGSGTFFYVDKFGVMLPTMLISTAFAKFI